MIRRIVFSDFTNGTGKTPDGTILTNDILAAHAAAVQEQLCGAVANAWYWSQLNFRVGAPNGADLSDNEWLMGYWQTSDQPGAAGYHATDPQGRPYGKIFLDDAQSMSQGSQAASVLASHETCEIRGDSTANLLAIRSDGSTFDAFELCDAVEDTTYTASNGVEVSNFLLPNAFDPGASGPYDHLGALSDQYGMTPGGYRITGVASIGPNADRKIEFMVTFGPAVDKKKKLRKMRKHSRANMRGAR